MSPGDKSYKSEGFVTQTNISGKSSTDMKVVVNTSVSALKKATGENLKMQITFSINPKNTILKNQINAVKSQIKNIPIIIIETNKQKINTSNMELVGVIPQKKKE